MEQLQKTPTRKKILLWGAALLSSLTVLRFIPGSKKEKKGTGNTTVKMLTQDGKLVEVDVEKLACGKRKKINDEQLKNWVSKK
jgi:hypothetical protein